MQDNFVSLFKLQLKNVLWDYSRDCDDEGVVHDVLRSKLSKNTELTVSGFVIPLLYTVTFYKGGY